MIIQKHALYIKNIDIMDVMFCKFDTQTCLTNYELDTKLIKLV